MLDEKQFIDGFTDVMEREKERFLKANTPEEINDARRGYLECAAIAVKIQANDNTRLIEDGKIQVEIEKTEKEMTLKSRAMDEDFQIRYKQASAEAWKEIGGTVLGIVKVGLVGTGLALSFLYEANGNIYSGKTSGGFMSGIFKKPTDYLK